MTETMTTNLFFDFTKGTRSVMWVCEQDDGAVWTEWRPYNGETIMVGHTV